MLRLSDNTSLREQLGWTHDRNLFTETICHGPAALLSADTGNRLIYQKYQIVAFPAVTNKQTPMVGYMPRPMPWCFEEKLNVFWGNSLVNTKPDTTYHLDRRLVTSASPKAANNFGRLARNNRDCKNVENLPISPLICRAQNLLPPSKDRGVPTTPEGLKRIFGAIDLSAKPN